MRNISSGILQNQLIDFLCLKLTNSQLDLTHAVSDMSLGTYFSIHSLFYRWTHCTILSMVTTPLTFDSEMTIKMTGF